MPRRVLLGRPYVQQQAIARTHGFRVELGVLPAEQARRQAEAQRAATEQGRAQAGGRDVELGRQLKQQVQERIGKDPAAAAAILKGWMHGG